jgi:hypothetical protein
MNALPYFRLDIRTTLTVEQAKSLLRTHIRPQRRFRFSWPARRGYEGFAYAESRFRLNRLIAYRNSFLPLVYVRVDDEEGGARVRALASMHPAVVVFVFGWILGVSIQACDRLPEAAASGHLVRALAFWLGAVVVMYGFAMGLFWPEAIKARAFVTDLFASHLAPPPN